MLQENNPDCSTFKAFSIIASLFCAASFTGVVAISADRFLAIHLHLRYQELVTQKRIVAVVISVWVMSAFLSLLTHLVPFDIMCLITFIIRIVCLLPAIMVYFRIYLAVRSHKNQIQSQKVQQPAQNVEVANFAGLIKYAVDILYVYLVFLFCYLPHMICWAAIEFNGTSIALKKFYFISQT